jgi:hypothetical protein
MSTQVHGREHPRLMVALVALTLTAVLVVMAVQVGSIWSTRIGSPARTAYVGPSGFHPNFRPHGCRPKYGCEPAGGPVTGP